MRVSRWTILPLVFTIPLACSDGTAPPPAILEEYYLESIDGRPLPATIHAGDGYTTTVLWSILSFDVAANARLVEGVRLTSPTDPPTEITRTTEYSYEVTGNHIAFDYRLGCQDTEVCVAPPTGTLDGTTLTLSWSTDSPRRSALYRLAVRID